MGGKERLFFLSDDEEEVNKRFKGKERFWMALIYEEEEVYEEEEGEEEEEEKILGAIFDFSKLNDPEAQGEERRGKVEFQLFLSIGCLRGFSPNFWEEIFKERDWENVLEMLKGSTGQDGITDDTDIEIIGFRPL